MGKAWKSIKRVWRLASNADLAWSLLGYIGLAKALGALVFALAVAVTAYWDAMPWWVVLLAAGGAFVVAIWAINGVLYYIWGRKPVLVTGPSEADARRNITDVATSPVGDTLAAIGTVTDPSPEEALGRLIHTCYVVASTQRMKTAGFIELSVIAYNASDKTLILSDVVGNARCTVDDEEGRQIKEKLPTPDLIRLAPKRQIPPFSEFVMTLNQAVSPHFAGLILTTAKRKTVTLDFEGLWLEFAPFGEPGPTARLKLWDGVGIAAARGLRSGRAMILRVQAAVCSSSAFGSVEGKSE